MGIAEKPHIEALRSMPLFSAVADDALAGLLAQAATLRRKAGVVLFAPGEPAERFFVILAGRVKLYKLSPRGDEQILHLYGPGSAFAEAAALGGGTYPAFAETVEPTTLLAVGRRELRRAVEACPEMAMAMLAGMSAKLREFNRLIEDLSLKEVPARLAGLLLHLADEAGALRFRLPYAKRQLAARIGTVSETLSRAFRKLQDAGLLRVRGAEVTLLDRAALAELAEGNPPENAR